MSALVTIGTIITLAGIAGLGACIVMVARIRRAGLDEEETRRRLQRVIAWNLGALAVSAIGLMAVIAGIMLG